MAMIPTKVACLGFTVVYQCLVNCMYFITFSYRFTFKDDTYTYKYNPCKQFTDGDKCPSVFVRPVTTEL